MRYRGDSPGKKLARFHFWNFVDEYLHSRSSQYKIAILASRFGGDISCLKYFEVAEGDIVASDLNYDSLRICSEKYKNITIHHGCISDAVSNNKCDIVHFDSCSNINRETIDISQRIIQNIPIGGYFGVSMLMGREHGKVINSHTSNIPVCSDLKKYVRRKSIKITNTIAINRRGGTKKAKSSSYMNHVKIGSAGLFSCAIRKINPKNSLDRAKLRIEMLTYNLLFSGRGRFVLPVYISVYRSNTKHSVGSPMVMAWFRVMSTKLLKKNRNKMPGIPNIDCVMFDFINRNPMKTIIDIVNNRNLSSDQYALAFNVSKMTVAAWRANCSMGTYGEI